MKTVHLSPDRPVKEHFPLLSCWCQPIKTILREGLLWRRVKLIIHRETKETQ